MSLSNLSTLRNSQADKDVAFAVFTRSGFEITSRVSRSFGVCKFLQILNYFLCTHLSIMSHEGDVLSALFSTDQYVQQVTCGKAL